MLHTDTHTDTHTQTHTHTHTHTDTHNGVLLNHKKNEVLSYLTTWIELEVFRLSEISQRKPNTV